MALGTNKPLGSADVRDLLANAVNLDDAVNGDAKEWTDRLGQTRVTMKGVEEAVPDALIARDQAQDAAAAAALARDGALAGAEIYPTEAAGRAAVADGKTFNVQGSGAVAAYQYRRVSAEASMLLAAFPASASTAKISDLARTDERTMRLIGETATGVGISDLVDFDREYLAGLERAWVTEAGSIAAQITTESEFQAAGPTVVERVQTGLRAGVCHILGIGQSWMGGTGGAPAISTIPVSAILMFIGGIRPTDTLAAPDCFASLVPAVESNNASNVRGETPMSGFARGLADAIQADEGLSLDGLGSSLLISVVAPGGQALGGFTRGGVYWTQIVEQIQAGYARAQELGETYRLLCCPFIIGKGDYDSGQPDLLGFEITLGGLVDDLNEFMQALIPGHPTVPLMVFQTASHGHLARLPTVDLALNKLDREHPLVALGGILSAYPRAPGDVVHYGATAYRDLGRAGGALMKQWIFTGTKPEAMLPVEVDAQRAVISLRYRPPKLPLVLDAAGSGNPANYGFELVDAAGVALPISSISVKRDRVIVIAAQTLPAGWQLRYAWSGAFAAGVISGPRGALRDSSPNPNWAALIQVSDTDI